jgi:polysaccharide transporter, PST family
MRQILVVLSQAIYPKICQFAQESHQSLRGFYKKLFIPFFGLYFVFSCLVFLFADFTVFILAKKHIPEATHLLRLLCFTPFIVGLNIPAYQTLLAYEHQKSYMMILSLGSLLSVFLNLGLSWAFQADGTAISIIITETFITIGLHWILHKNHPKERLFA